MDQILIAGYPLAIVLIKTLPGIQFLEIPGKIRAA